MKIKIFKRPIVKNNHLKIPILLHDEPMGEYGNEDKKCNLGFLRKILFIVKNDYCIKMYRMVYQWDHRSDHNERNINFIKNFYIKDPLNKTTF